MFNCLMNTAPGKLTIKLLKYTNHYTVFYHLPFLVDFCG